MDSACYRHPNRQTKIVCQRCERPICPDCMIQGAVGFHCPDCVQAAPKVKLKTRRVQPNQVTSAVIAAINLVVWLAILATGMHTSALVDTLALTPYGYCPVSAEQILRTDPAGCASYGARWMPGVATGAFWQVITSAFVHVEPWHVLFNMMALWILGPQVEGVLGRARFLALYFFSALTASAIVMTFAAPFSTTLGASGAVFGLMGAFLAIALKRQLDVRGILMWLGLNAVFTFLVPNVSWEGHLGGFLGGMGIAGLMMYLPRTKRKLEWWLIALLFAVVVGVIVALSLVLY